MLAQHEAQSEQTLVGTMVVVANQQIGGASIERWLANAPASTSDLEKAVKQLEQNLAECLQVTDWIESERAFSRLMLDTAATNPDEAAAQSVVSLSGFNEQTARAWQVFRGTIGRHTEIWTRVWNKFEAWCALPAREALQPGRSWDEAQLPTEESAYRLVFMSGFGRSGMQPARNEAQLGWMLIFAAIKLYEKKNGRPPATLSELKGDCLSELPTDPFSGRDYIYTVRGRDWILYSIWGNLVDDGGAGSWPHKTSEDKDLIWRNTPIQVEPQRN